MSKKQAKCHYCCKIYKISPKSIKANIKRNGVYRCQSCASKMMHSLKTYKYYWKNRHDVKCIECNKIFNRKGRSILDNLKKHGHFICLSCCCKDLEWRKKVGKGVSKAWELKPELRFNLLKRLKMKRISSIQKILYSILDDMKLLYTPSFDLGYYEFDCLIPKQNDMAVDLLIECQGEYWHSLRSSVRRDKAKATYIERYFPLYDLKYLWEHEFYTKNKIIDKIKYWTHISKLDIINFTYGDIIIRRIKHPEVHDLLSKYHYLPNAGRGGVVYGAFINDILMACCVFSTVSRLETAHRLSCKTKEIKELTRFCIHPSYRKKNFGSWFLSRCLKNIKNDMPILKTIVSFCDTTYNHHGALYKACNFKFDGTLKPDYWYVDKDGYVMHKKTLYNRAKKMKMIERDYADDRDYNKVWGHEKLRFIYCF